MKSLKKLDKRQQQRFLLVLLILCISFVLYYYLLLKPKLTQLMQSIAEVKEVRQKVLDARDEIDRENSLKLQLKELEETQQKYQSAIPVESDLSSILDYLSVEAKNSGITLLGVEPTEQESRIGPFRTLKLSLRAKAGYHSLGKFLSQLEGGERFIEVDAFEIRGDAKSPREHNIQLSLRTYAFEAGK